MYQARGGAVIYVVQLKTAIRDALSRTFAAPNYPEGDFQGLYVSIEYPDKPQAYPGIWVDYEPMSLHIIGVDHKEFVDSAGPGIYQTEITRWRFEGNASFTIVAFSSLERDRIYDEVVAAVAFGQENAARSVLRTVLEDNEFIAMDADWDDLTSGGMSAGQGTPWGSDEVLYEATLSLHVLGDFIAPVAAYTGTLVPLSAVKTTPIIQGKVDPTTTGGWV